MFRVNVFYPATEDQDFDHEYYSTKHVERVRRRMGELATNISVTRGLAGVEPGSPPTYTTVFSMDTPDLEAFGKVFAEFGEELTKDVADNVTQIQGIVQISEVLHQD